MRKTDARLVDTGSDHRAVIVDYDVPAPLPRAEPVKEPETVTYHYLTDLADAARKSGLTVVEISGWKSRGRPASTGGFSPRGVCVHHTGSKGPDSRAYVDWLFLTGRTDLPAPLCQIALGRDGTVYVGAAGRGNHAGKSQASGPIPAGDGNELYVGIEALNSGSEGWAPAQYTAYVRLCAALVAHYGWTADHVRAHKETSVTGKWDPGLLDMTQFRRDITDTLTPTTTEDDMPTPADLWRHEIPLDKGEKVPAQLALRWARNESRRALDQSRATDKTVQELAAKVDALIEALKEKS